MSKRCTSITNSQITAKSPIWVTHLAKFCPQQASWMIKKKPKTAVIAPFDPHDHNHAQNKLQQFLINKDWAVEIEKVILAKFGNYTIGHYFDLYAKKKKEELVIEIKPQDRAYYEEQYFIAMIILKIKKINANYLVYEYHNQAFIPKTLQNYSMAKNALLQKINTIFSDNPSRNPSKGCQYCPYSICNFHSQYKTNNDIIEQTTQEIIESIGSGD